MNIQSLTKAEAIEIAKIKTNWTNKEVIQMVSTLKGTRLETTIVRIGDVHTTNGLGHPAVVFKIADNTVYSVLLTTDETCLAIIKKCDSRFFPDSYLTGTVTVMPKDKVLANLYRTYDNNKEIQKLKKYLIDIYKHILK